MCIYSVVFDSICKGVKCVFTHLISEYIVKESNVYLLSGV